MKIIRVFLIFLCFAFGGQIYSVSGKKKKLLLFDTSQGETYAYQPFIDIAKSVGFIVNYKPIAEIIDGKIEEFSLEEQDAIFFLFNSQYLLSLTTKSVVTTKVLSVIRDIAQKPNKLVGIILPSFRGDVAVLQPILSQLNIRLTTTTESYSFNFPIDEKMRSRSLLMTRNMVELFGNLLQRFVDVPLELRTMNYHTTLSPPSVKHEFNIKIKNLTKVCPIALLPIKKNKENTLLPYGIYSFNPKYKNHLFVGSFSALTFAGIMENFRIYPMKHEYRKLLLDDLQEMLWELYLLLNQTGGGKTQIKSGIDLEFLKGKTKPELPPLALFGMQKDQKNKQPLRVAWLEIEVFKKPDEKTKQGLLIDYIYRAGLDYLWISISPNMYYSTIGKYSKEKEELLRGISIFTRNLKEKASKLSTVVPKILIGFEVANNLCGTNLPSIGACDIYRNKYYDVPTPLDHAFWNSEVIESLTKFTSDWNKPEVSHGVPIDGIVLDLELYGRKTSAGFLSTMGFNKQTFDTFISSNGLEANCQNRWKYLLETRQMKNYFSFLYDQAVKLGETLKTSFRNLIPDCKIGCYIPNIAISWFYKGLYVGLSDRIHNEPFLLFTFNSEFDSHKEWLRKNKINCEHLSALMLSKIRSEKDFELVSGGNKWLNRFSRVIDEQDQLAWYANEQSPLIGDQFVKFLNYLKISKVTD